MLVSKITAHHEQVVSFVCGSDSFYTLITCFLTNVRFCSHTQQTPLKRSTMVFPSSADLLYSLDSPAHHDHNFTVVFATTSSSYVSILASRAALSVYKISHYRDITWRAHTLHLICCIGESSYVATWRNLGPLTLFARHWDSPKLNPPPGPPNTMLTDLFRGI